MTNPMPSLPSPPPHVSSRTIPIAGLWVDVYGVDEAQAAHASRVAVLWLHHPRLGSKEVMADIAARCVHAVNETSSTKLVAAAFDQRNHGTRCIAPLANQAWRDGNEQHAQDMFSSITGAVADTRQLMDLLVGGYVLPQARAVQHLVLGVSLGGHAGWQLLFADPRVTAGVLIIGCPDYMSLIHDRARLSKRPSYKTAQHLGGAPFFGSVDFPRALVEACYRHDPKALLFGSEPVSPPGKTTPKQRDLVRQRLAGKRILVCTGGADKLVPYKYSKPFVTWLEEVGRGEGDVKIDNRVYEGVKHAFSAEMVDDAIAFVVSAVEGKREAKM